MHMTTDQRLLSQRLSHCHGRCPKTAKSCLPLSTFESERISCDDIVNLTAKAESPSSPTRPRELVSAVAFAWNDDHLPVFDHFSARRQVFLPVVKIVKTLLTTTLLSFPRLVAPAQAFFRPSIDSTTTGPRRICRATMAMSHWCIIDGVLVPRTSRPKELP